MITAARYFILRSFEDRIPDHVARVIIHESLTFIPQIAFMESNIVEVICKGVKSIERGAFMYCPDLERIEMPCVETVGHNAFMDCYNLTDVVCNNLEVIGVEGFAGCTSLSSIDLSSAKVIEECALAGCMCIKTADIGTRTRTGFYYIGRCAFAKCDSLQKITISLRNDGNEYYWDGNYYGCIREDLFRGCEQFIEVELIGGFELLSDTIAALHFQEWRHEMKQKLEAINQATNPNGGTRFALRLREWLPEMSRKMTHYTQEHCRLLEEASSTIEDYLPNDIVMGKVLPFLELPKRTIGEGGEEFDLRSLLTCDDDEEEDEVSTSEEMDEESDEEEEEDCEDEDDVDVSSTEEMDEESNEEEEEDCEESHYHEESKKRKRAVNDDDEDGAEQHAASLAAAAIEAEQEEDTVSESESESESETRIKKMRNFFWGIFGWE